MSFSHEQLMKILNNESFQLSEPTTPQVQPKEDETQLLQKQLLELVQQNQQFNSQLTQIKDQITKQDLIYQNLTKTQQRLENQLQEQMQKKKKLQEECDLKDQEEKELIKQVSTTRPKKRLFTQQSVGKVINYNVTYNNNQKKNSVIVSIKK
ncbi:unnamed protein product (macronuclear) [Paramecium tetraurelia]|uniref:Uncharacterized protein n=1 Tax=Paramecium tetraurelia TaxID=5888 RepID=A0EBB6_PARTE|nr:uncharacterized protein GSPATT00025317001 [Paramecium tetraurelia]CAK92583.1 unnamed protein product [Paramecium tetraurelia]|eukprot:XP_001459980.1 hypothetical protein (macronuclear) [Paramecium tetraurelia strain d4-2]